MRKTVRKWFWVWDFDKEEQWLNEMAAQGLVLVDVGWCKYVFEDSVPGEYQVRLELLENQPSHEESQKYIRFIEDTGAEQVGAFLRWVYFRKKTADGPFDLFSDLQSRIKHIKRIYDVSAVSLPANPSTEIYPIAQQRIHGAMEELRQELLERERKVKILKILTEAK